MLKRPNRGIDAPLKDSDVEAGLDLAEMPETIAAPAPKRSALERLSHGVASQVDRRKFLRRAAQTGVLVTAGIVSGTGFSLMREGTAFADCGGPYGGGCPKVKDYSQSGAPYVSLGCGPSRCCSAVRDGTSANCDCASGTTCHNDGTYCFGSDHRDWSSGCWSCTTTVENVNGCFDSWTATCCDCATSRSLCGDPFVSNTAPQKGRCIGATWSKVVTRC